MNLIQLLLSTLAGKIAVAGAGLAIAGGAAAGATGNLPDGLTNRIGSVLGQASEQVPDLPEEGEAPDVDQILDDVLPPGADSGDQSASTQTEDDPEADSDDADENADFGQSVADDARTSGVDGREIAERARQRDNGSDTSSSDSRSRAQQGLNRAGQASGGGDASADEAAGDDADTGGQHYEQNAGGHAPDGVPPAGPLN